MKGICICRSSLDETMVCNDVLISLVVVANKIDNLGNYNRGKRELRLC